MILFEKYQGLQNDFIIIDCLNLEKNKLSTGILNSESVKKICNRKKGVGADGIIYILDPERSDAPEILCELKIINSDGSFAETCGNGIRCVYQYLLDNDFINSKAENKRVTLKSSPENLVSCELKNNQICVDMGLAQVSEQSIIEENIKISKIQIGNKHLVIDLSDLGLGLETVNDYLERFKAESQEYNIEFIVYDSFKKSIDIRVHEIGAGFTDACGSGACASVVALMDRDLVSNGDKVKVNFVGGSLDIISTEEENRYRVHMIGPAEKVFSGYLEI